MLCGYEPFYGETEKELMEANKGAVVEFPESDWGSISPEATDLLRKMVSPDPSERITAKEALQHEWIVKHTAAKEVPNLVLPSGHLGAGHSSQGVCSVS